MLQNLRQNLCVENFRLYMPNILRCKYLETALRRQNFVVAEISVAIFQVIDDWRGTFGVFGCLSNRLAAAGKRKAHEAQRVRRLVRDSGQRGVGRSAHEAGGKFTAALFGCEFDASAPANPAKQARFWPASGVQYARADRRSGPAFGPPGGRTARSV